MWLLESHVRHTTIQSWSRSRAATTASLPQQAWSSSTQAWSRPWSRPASVFVRASSRQRRQSRIARISRTAAVVGGHPVAPSPETRLPRKGRGPSLAHSHIGAAQLACAFALKEWLGGRSGPVHSTIQITCASSIRSPLVRVNRLPRRVTHVKADPKPCNKTSNKLGKFSLIQPRLKSENSCKSVPTPPG